MLSIFEYLKELYSSSHVEDATTGYFDQIEEHLIKILRFRDPINLDKHIKDIKSFLKICISKISKSKRKISIRKLEKWYSLNSLKYNIDFQIKSLEEDYGNLPTLIKDRKMIFRVIEKTLKEIIKWFSYCSNNPKRSGKSMYEINKIINNIHKNIKGDYYV